MSNPLLTDDLTDEICNWLISGQPLADYCAQDGKPSLGTVNQWRAYNDIFAKRFNAARDIGFDSIAERLRTTVRGTVASTSDWRRDRLIAETELKLLAAWAPRRYGARIDGEQNIGNMDVGELGARVGLLLEKAMQAFAGRPPTKPEDVTQTERKRPTAPLPDDASFLTPGVRAQLQTDTAGFNENINTERNKRRARLKKAADKIREEPKTGADGEETEDRW